MIPPEVIARDVEELGRRRPFAIVGRSSWPPHEHRVLARVETDYVAKAAVQRDYVPAGFEDVYVVDERSNARWYPPAVTA